LDVPSRGTGGFSDLATQSLFSMKSPEQKNIAPPD
jgi:hypothetical protein